jgi:hypothetical protein
MKWNEFAQASHELAALGRERLTDPFHLFATEIQSAGFVTFADDEPYGMAWDPTRGVRHWTQRLE